MSKKQRWIENYRQTPYAQAPAFFWMSAFGFIALTIALHLAIIDGEYATGGLAKFLYDHQSWVYILDGVAFGLYWSTASFAIRADRNGGANGGTSKPRITRVSYEQRHQMPATGNGKPGAASEPRSRRVAKSDENSSKRDGENGNARTYAPPSERYRYWREGNTFVVRAIGDTKPESAIVEIAEINGWAVAENGGRMEFIIGNKIYKIKLTTGGS